MRLLKCLYYPRFPPSPLTLAPRPPPCLALLGSRHHGARGAPRFTMPGGHLAGRPPPHAAPAPAARCRGRHGLWAARYRHHGAREATPTAASSSSAGPCSSTPAPPPVTDRARGARPAGLLREHRLPRLRRQRVRQVPVLLRRRDQPGIGTLL